MQQAQLVPSEGNPGNGSGRHPRLLEGLLSSLPMFDQVARSQISVIASHSRLQYARRGATICRRGERLPGMLAMGYGIVKLALRRHDAETKVVQFLGANETFGESTILLDRPCPVDVVALEDSMFAVVPAAPLLRLIELDPKFARNVIGALGRKFLGLLDEFEASVHCSSLQRLARYLESLAGPQGVNGASMLRLPASKTEIAARLGIAKETMSRLLRELASRGLISVTQREIEIRDRAGLAKQAG